MKKNTWRKIKKLKKSAKLPLSVFSRVTIDDFTQETWFKRIIGKGTLPQSRTRIAESYPVILKNLITYMPSCRIRGRIFLQQYGIISPRLNTVLVPTNKI